MNVWTAIAGGSGFVAVAMGAFGAHALKERATPDLMAVYQTGATYHLIHSVALLAVALYAQSTERPAGYVLKLWLAGIVLFSGSLYLLALTGARKLGMVTPVGGLCFLGGWLACALQLARPSN